MMIFIEASPLARDAGINPQQAQRAGFPVPPCDSLYQSARPILSGEASASSHSDKFRFDT
jgi:hypothetical protein